MNQHDPLASLLEQLTEQIARRAHELQTGQSQQPAPQASPWMNIAGAARYLDLPKQRLYKLTATGDIPHYKQGGRLLFHQAELDHWLRQYAAHHPPIAS